MDDKDLHALLFTAIRHHNESLLDDLLAGGQGAHLLDVPGEDGNTLLHLAVMENNIACVDCLLKNGADPNTFDTNQARMPLHLAVELGLTDIVKTFIDLEHVNLELRDDRNLTCYEIAQFCDNQNLAELIDNRRQEIEQFRNDFYTVLNQACSNDDCKLVKTLLEKFCKQILDRLPKCWHSHKDGRSLARSILRDMINWSSTSWNDVTLLFKSASKGYTSICKLLIEYGATAKCNENTNYSPLYVAAYGGYTETVRLLLDSFPSLIQEVTIERWTVLHACCLQGHSETAKLILNYQYPESLKRRYVSRSGLYEYNFAFNLNTQDAAGQTVIYLAVSATKESLLDTLLQFKIEAKCIQQSPSHTFPVKTDNDSRRNSQTQDRSVIGQTRIIPDRPILKQDPDLAMKGNTGTQLDKILRQLQRFKTKDPSSTNDRNTTGSTYGTTCIKLDNSDMYLICPFEMDTYCDYNSKTALHLAVCQQYHNIATTLLVNGSNPNLPILFRDSINKSGNSDSSSNLNGLGGDIGLNWLRSSKSTCLKEACRLNDETMCEILIRYGANDNQDNLALHVAALNKNNRLISMFLSLKSNIDPEYKINRKCNVEFASRYKQNQRATRNNPTSSTTTFSSMFPSTPVTIDWRNLKCIKQIDPQWLIDASLMHNKRLRHPTNSLMAITRLDLSCNNLKSLHPVIFRLPSLRELNLSSNRLESLMDLSHQFHGKHRALNEGESVTPTSKMIESHRAAMRRSKSSNFSGVNLENSNLIDLNEPQEWDLPCLEVLDLHDNLLIALPDCLFELPKLSELDVSSNQLRQLPWAMWTAPELREVIASGNLLDDLPRVPPLSRQYLDHSPLETIGDSPTREKISSSPKNQSFERLENISADNSLDLQVAHRTGKQFLENIDTAKTCLELHPTKVVHLNHWSKRIDLIESNQRFQDDTTSASNQDGFVQQLSKLTYLNLSHNSFTSIPPVLACIAAELMRFNLSHNCLQTLGDISLLPARLKNLDLSNNQIASWFQCNQADNDTKHCFVENVKAPTPKVSALKVQRGYGNLLCPHKSHQRLDNLKSLNLSRNYLKNIELYAQQPQRRDSPMQSNTSASSSLNISRSTARDSFASSHSGTTSPMAPARNQLFFPNLTALDLSFNQIQRVPESLSELKDLSVLNLSENHSISTLPAELGLATKLWNLGVNGCNLSEPLKSIVESKTYKTMDIIGYLRSIFEEAKPYARMKLMLVGLQGIGKTSLLEQMRQEGSSANSRRRAPEHWTKRMGHSSRGNLRNQKGVTLSTVGVDIHDWIFQKKGLRNQPNYGPVSFSTWDFGGQEEFYATHRYFLSRRSMYLVVWKMVDGLQGILGIQQWLVNIQSRAPGSPVIIVGTHEDMIEGGEKGAKVHELQAEIYRRFINVSDHDKCGLPQVADSIVISTKTRLNIRNLCNRIYDVVFSLRCPGSTERLLEQKIPATYLYLEEIINSLVHDRQQKKRDPVLAYSEYRHLTSEQLKTKYNKHFRDLEPMNSREINYNSELQQATRFLHENGVLLHYEDANLRDLYFLDPQWLCDILSHVVTIREINPHVKNGLMKIDDLVHLFKSMDVNVSGGVQSYVVNLLNKFEVALTWNSQYLLIPSLLPRDPEALQNSFKTQSQQNQRKERFQVKITPRMRGRSAMRRPIDTSQAANRQALTKSIRATSIDPSRRKLSQSNSAQADQAKHFYVFESEPEEAITRLVLLRYLPAGFFARLQSGLLSDPAFDDICEDLQLDLLNKLVDVGNEQLVELIPILGNRPGWLCWKNGIRLKLQKESTINTQDDDTASILEPPCLISLQEYSSSASEFSMDQVNFEIEYLEINPSKRKTSEPERPTTKPSDGVEIVGSKWIKFDQSQYSNVLMIVVSNTKLRITNKEDRSVDYTIGFSRQNIAKLLSKVVDHIDDLLEDWYPSLGARFAHTLGGNYLVTRILPCQKCSAAVKLATNMHSITAIHQDQQQRTSRQSARQQQQQQNVKFSINSATDRGSLMENSNLRAAATAKTSNSVHCFYVEHCILNVYNLNSSSSIINPTGGQKSRFNFNLNYLSSSLAPKGRPNSSSKVRNLHCPKHGSIELASVAPDIVFEDIPSTAKIDNEQIERCKLIGRGALGFVFKGSIHSAFPLNQLGQANQEVALKLLQPVDPGQGAEQADLAAYNSASTNWSREPFQSACKSYCSARHEINILQTLYHPNIVQFIGLCIRPLAIVLELAPMGSLEGIFTIYKRAGLRIDQHSVRKTILQVARALEFLHQMRIIYRDLKTENVLVWSFPSPFATQLHCASVELKLADYGISRQAQSTGIWKGFAGTINFLAPEILRHNGDEEYTEKVDCFSFGMLLYELLTLRPPFKQLGRGGILGDGGLAGAGANRSYLSELGTRPSLFARDLIYPNHFIDLMSICWSQEPHDRPTASQIVSIASTPEFMQVQDATCLAPISADSTSSSSSSSSLGFSCAIFHEQSDQLDLWWFQQNSLNTAFVWSALQNQWSFGKRVELKCHSGIDLMQSAKITASCLVKDSIWLFDSQQLLIHTLPVEAIHQQDDQSLLVEKSMNEGGGDDEEKEQNVDNYSLEVQSFPIDLTTKSREVETNSMLVVRQMLYVQGADCLLFLAQDGQLWICLLESKLACHQLEDGSMRFNCMAMAEDKVTDTPAGDAFQLFCGQANGISCMDISSQGEVRRQSILPLATKMLDTSGEQIVEPSQTTEVSLIVASREHLWTVAGCTVHLWSQRERHVIRKLDCWKLVPCSESLESINIEQYYEQARISTVISLVCVGDQLFAGTSHGCFVVIEANTLKPIIVFRPYESDLSIIKPMPSLNVATDSSNELRQLVTVGRGYRDLMCRYLNSLDNEDETNETSKGQLVAAILMANNHFNL